MKKLILVGGGGHAKVLASVLKHSGIQIWGYTSVRLPERDQISDIPYIGSDEAVTRHHPEEIMLVNGIGSVKAPVRRREIFEKFRDHGYRFLSVIHPHSIVDPEVLLGEGVQIMAGAIIQTGTKIGANSIINTGSSIDHDCDISDHVHIAPGSILSGGVTVGQAAHIGAGATIIQEVRIGAHATVGAGSVVLSNVADNETVAGVPSKVISS